MASSLVCVNCSSANPPESVFCSNCGTHPSQREATAAADDYVAIGFAALVNRVVGWLSVVAGIILFLLIANDSALGQYRWLAAFGSLLVVTISGIALVAFAELLELLVRVERNTRCLRALVRIAAAQADPQ